MMRWLLIACALIAFSAAVPAQTTYLELQPTLTESDGGCDGGCPLPPDNGDDDSSLVAHGCDGGCPLPPDDGDDDSSLVAHGCGDDDCGGDSGNDGDDK